MSNTITTIEAEGMPIPLSSSSHRLKTWARVLSHFLAGQACLQAVNAVTGLLLLRWLTVTAYAQFSVAFGFQSMIGMFVDLGFSGCIVALVGDRGHDTQVVGKYIRSAQHYRRRMFIVMALVSLAAFPLLTYKQHWGVTTSVLLLTTILAAVFFQGWGMYTAPLLINRRLKEVYTPQVASGLGRGALCFLLHTFGALSAWTTALVSAATLAINGLAYRRASRELAAEPAHSDPIINREMMKYLAPLFPVVIFTALQSQITLALITLFGQTRNIAEVAALSRLSQLFFALLAFNSLIIEPYFAKLALRHLLRRYIQLLFASTILTIGITATAFQFPGLLLSLLGPQYSYLRNDIGWIVAVSCLNYLAGVVYTINSARKWRYWWYSAIEIPIVLVLQIVGVVFLDLRTTLHVIFFTGLTNIAWLLTHSTVSMYGLYKTRRVQEASEVYA